MKIRPDIIVKITSFLMMALPILSIYRSPIPKIDLGSFLVIINFALVILSGHYRHKSSNSIVSWKFWHIYISYIINITIISLIFFKQYEAGSFYVLRMFKNILYMLFSLYACDKGFFEVRYSRKYYEILAIFSTLYIYAQAFSYHLFGYDLVGYAAEFVYTGEYASRASNIINNMFRPTSIFYEPAHFFQYISTAIVLNLIYPKGRHTFSKAIFYTIGVLISTSGQGIVFTAFIWGIWLLNQLKKRKSTAAIFAIGFLLVCTGILFCTQQGNQILMRISPSNKTESNAIIGRSVGFILLKDLPISNLFCGMGYGNQPKGFFSSWSFNLWCLGILGTLLIIYFYLYYFIHAQKKIVLILNALMGVFSDVFNGFYFIFYFSYIFVIEPDKKQVGNKKSR